MLILHPRYWNKQFFAKLAFYTSLCSIAIVSWQIWDASVPDDLWYWTTPQVRDFIWKNPFTPDYGTISIGEFLTRVRQNIVWGMSNNIAVLFLAPLYFLEGSYAGFFLSLPVALGLAWHWGKSFVKRPSVLEGFVAFSLLLMLVKYLGMASRYIAIVYPALLIYAFQATEKWGRKQTILIHSLILVSIATTSVMAFDQHRNPFGSRTLQDYIEAANQAKQSMPHNSVCSAPLLDHWQIMTGHKCFYKNRDISTLKETPGPIYLVGLASGAPRNLESFEDVEKDALSGALKQTLTLEQDPQLFKKTYENQTFALFEVVNGR